jgi:hypothetical protein
MPLRPVRGVGPRSHPDRCEKRLQVRSRHVEEWPNHRPLSPRDAGKTSRPGPFEDPHENCLDLIVSVMRGEDDAIRVRRIREASECVSQPAVPRRACLRLPSVRPKLEAGGFERETQPGGLIGNRGGDRAALWVDAVIDVAYDQLEGMLVNRRGEEME